MKYLPILLLGCTLGFYACKDSSPTKPQNTTSTEVKVPEQPAAKLPQSPDQSLGALFHDVQMQRVFADSKTFVDCTPKQPIDAIVKAYSEQKGKSGFSLKAFVEQYFEMPPNPTEGYKSDMNMPVSDHIKSLWPVLTRNADEAGAGTLIALPKPYVVPGGRFREIYYWDSYFTMLGLHASGQTDLMKNMCDNFKYLIETVGHIPNGNRSYYLSRSQPPYFSLMVRLLQKTAKDGNEANKLLLEYLPALEKEHAFWMRNVDKLPTDFFSAVDRVVRLPNDAILNRYWDDVPNPRPESYREDMETIKNSGRDSVEMCRHLKAGAESGWDYSSRWGAGKTLRDINTANIVPVDLNCLLWHLEQTLSDAYVVKGEMSKAQLFGKKAYDRKLAIHDVFFDSATGYYMDFDFVNKNKTGIMSLAGMYPAFFDIHDQNANASIAKTVEKTFLKPGGVVSTNNYTGQQWDAPNGWAPLQWITIQGLRNAKSDKLADQIKGRWLSVNESVFKRTGKMLEKYNVENIQLATGGGEYPVQDGFGWTNGVYLALKAEKK